MSIAAGPPRTGTSCAIHARLRARPSLVLCQSRGSTPIAIAETGVTGNYAERAWDEYTKDAIFPRDGDASDAAVQALIDISALIRAARDRVKSSAAEYINRDYLHEAQREIAAVPAPGA